MERRILCILLAAIMVFSLLPVTAFAGDGSGNFIQISGINYGETTIKTDKGSMKAELDNNNTVLLTLTGNDSGDFEYTGTGIAALDDATGGLRIVGAAGLKTAIFNINTTSGNNTGYALRANEGDVEIDLPDAAVTVTCGNCAAITNDSYAAVWSLDGSVYATASSLQINSTNVSAIRAASGNVTLESKSGKIALSGGKSNEYEKTYHAVIATGDITITSEGDLKVESYYYGLLSKTGNIDLTAENITFPKSNAVDAKDKTVGIVCSTGDVRIKSAGKVEISSEWMGVYCPEGNVTVESNGTFSVNSEIRNKKEKGTTVTYIAGSNTSLDNCISLSKDESYGIKLAGDHALNAPLEIPKGKTITIDLNGYSISRTLASSTDNGNVITVNGNLTIKDSSNDKDGKITGGNSKSYGAGVRIERTGSFTQEAGLITDNHSQIVGGGVMALGSYTMKGGAVTNNTAVKAGGGVYVQNTMTLTDGEISGNEAERGAGVYVDHQNTETYVASPTTHFTMTGGKIKNNVASDKGGGVYADNYDIDVLLLGGEISGNTAVTLGGGVAANMPITVGGKVVIKDNTVSEKANNVYLRNVSKGTYAPVINISEATALASGADIGVTLESGIGTIATVTGDVSEYFKIDAVGTKPVYEENKLVIKVVVVSNANELINAIANAPYNTEIPIILNGNINPESALSIPAGKQITLDLNGFTLDRGLSESDAVIGGRVFAVAGKLIVKDSSRTGTGKITGGNTTEHGGAVYVAAGGEFILNGGTITGNKTTVCGGAVFVKAGGKATANGGTISGNTAGKGNGIYVEETATVAVSGKVSVDDIYLEKNVVIAAGDTLTTDSTIGVTFDSKKTDSVIATSNNDRASVFKIADIDKYVAYNSGNKTLVIAEGVTSAEQLQACINANKSPLKLQKDITLTEQLSVPTGKTVTIDLNGFSIKRDPANPAENGRIFAVDGNLTVKDSSNPSTGKLTGGNNTGKGGAVYVGAGGSFTLESGSITGNKAGFGGGVYADGVVTLKGGSITGNESNDAGGGVYANNTVTVDGTAISGNTAASFGGGIYLGKYANDATKDSTISKYFTMTGGKISGNTAGRRGGGVCVDYYDIGMKMPGGEISGNTVTADVGKDANDAGGGGIWAPKGVTVGGTAVVKGNKLVDKDKKETTNNIYLPNTKYGAESFKDVIKITVSSEIALASGADIGVTLESGTGAFTSDCTSGDAVFFSTDDSSHIIKFNSNTNALELTAIPTIYVAGTKVTSENKADIFGDGTASYDPQTNTLTLNGLNLAKKSYYKLPNPVPQDEVASASGGTNAYAYIYAEGDLNIIVTGTNNIAMHSSTSSSESGDEYGIYCGGALNMSGTGSLNFDVATSGYVGDSGHVYDGDYKDGSWNAPHDAKALIYARNSVTVNSGTYSNTGLPWSAIRSRNITINNGKFDFKSYGHCLYSENFCTTQELKDEKIKLTINGGELNLSDDRYNPTYSSTMQLGMYSIFGQKDVYINGGVINIKSHNGICGDRVEIDGKDTKVTISNNEAENHHVSSTDIGILAEWSWIRMQNGCAVDVDIVDSNDRAQAGNNFVLKKGAVTYNDEKEKDYAKLTVSSDSVLNLNGVQFESNDCEYEKKTAHPISGETYLLRLNGADRGEFEFVIVPGGWSIREAKENGKYLAVSDGRLSLSKTAFVWTYANGTFSTDVKTVQKTNGHWVLFIYVPGTTKTVTTTYYLSSVVSGAILSTSPAITELYQTVTGEHVEALVDCGEYHKIVCDNCKTTLVEYAEHEFDENTHLCECGAYDPEFKSVEVLAMYQVKTQKKSFGLIGRIFGLNKNITTYTATVYVRSTGANVKKIEVSAREDGGWTTSPTFTSKTPIKKFYTRITTSDGKTRLYAIIDGVAYPAN